MVKTNYGFRKQGSSNFVIVAPHAAGDDLKTKEIAEQICKELNASIVVNKKYRKPSKSRVTKPRYIEDFNKLPWSNKKQAYDWNKRHLHMKEFYNHINKYAKNARKQGNGRAIIIYIHGMRNNNQEIGIDIGCGARYHEDKLRGPQG